ncbi:MAG: phosphoribosylformylglycinamidine synthase [Limisphaerales bacterium]
MFCGASKTLGNNSGWLAFGWFSRIRLLVRVAGPDMKAKIVITPKKAVFDPQGKTVQNALEHMGYTGVEGVHVGKYIEIDLADGDPEEARKKIDEAAHKFLSNPVIEDYHIEIE